VNEKPLYLVYLT